MRLVLASQSPYRKELLNQLGLDFDTSPAHIDEDSFKASVTEALELTQVLAYEKAKKVFSERSEDLIIGSDQAIILGNKIFSKPKTIKRACEQIKELQGKSHHLISAVCLLGPNIKEEFYHKTTLTMRALTDEEILHYVKSDMPLQCAGSYMIEKLGISLFEAIDSTDSTSVVGLPLIQLTSVLRKLGMNPLA